MDEIRAVVNKDPKVNEIIQKELCEFNNLSDATKIEYGIQLLVKVRRYEEAFKLAGAFMIDDEKEYQDCVNELNKLKNENEYYIKIIEEYKKQKGEIDTSFIERKMSQEISENKSDRQVFNTYLDRKFKRMGINRADYKLMAVKK